MLTSRTFYPEYINHYQYMNSTPLNTDHSPLKYAVKKAAIQERVNYQGKFRIILVLFFSLQEEVGRGL